MEAGGGCPGCPAVDALGLESLNSPVRTADMSQQDVKAGERNGLGNLTRRWEWGSWRGFET